MLRRSPLAGGAKDNEMNEQLIATIGKQIERLNALAEFAAEIPELVGVTGHGNVIGGASFGFEAPYNTETIRQNREILEAAGWKLNRERQWTDDGTFGQFYRKDGYELDIFYRPNYAGSTCKLNILGYEQKPIYEVTCLDAEPLAEAQ
jgi:hypothetical protein